MRERIASSPATEAVAEALTDPERWSARSPAAWNALLRALRSCALLATFGDRISACGLLGCIPEKAHTQMHYAEIAAASARTAVRYEVNRMLRALDGYDGPIVLLKGAAYEFHGLAAGRGRVIGDLDVMVPRSRLEEVERALLQHGWESTVMDRYDEHYYRDWSHELPALAYPGRETPIDLHHTIAPPMSRTRAVAEVLFAAAVATRPERLQVLSPADMVVHATVHLFNDEVRHPLRDLYDLHRLIEEFGTNARFWGELLQSTASHGVERPLYYMLQHTCRVFGTTVPEEVLDAAGRSRPTPATRRCMEALFRRRFTVEASEERAMRWRVVRGVYSARAHWLRMPPARLMGHLARKGMRRARARWAGAAVDNGPAHTPAGKP